MVNICGSGRLNMQPMCGTLNPVDLIRFEIVVVIGSALASELTCINKMCYALMWNNFTEQGVLTCFSFLFTGGSDVPLTFLYFSFFVKINFIDTLKFLSYGEWFL